VPEGGRRGAVHARPLALADADPAGSPADSGDEPASRAPAAAARAVGKQFAVGLARAYCGDLPFEVDRRYEWTRTRFARDLALAPNDLIPRAITRLACP
jgi:hypothetical protein